jgi:dienelactone hydrolase
MTGGTAGVSSGGAAGTAGLAGASPTGGSAGTAGGAGTCAMGAWPAADPAVAGPFETVTEMNVGPTAGEGADGGAPVAFTMFRPSDLAASGLCHPVVTWGNGTGSTPNLYGVFLRHLASHGFVVIASNSPQVSRGDPPPMVVGVTWVLEQNDDPTSALYRRIDTAHIGATGHSQGGFATTQAAGDSRITTIAPLCGASQQRNLSGPAFIFCGELDTTVPCENVQNAFDSITSQPAMLANYLTADHANFITFRGTNPSPVEAATTAWFRVHLMGDTALRSWFYGPSCGLCTDAAWEITQKNMDP